MPVQATKNEHLYYNAIREEEPTKSKIDNEVAIIWFHQGPLGSHAGIVVDNKPYGFEPIGFKSISPSSLETAVGRVLSGEGQAEAITLLWLKVTKDQKREILEKCQRDFVPGYSCMNIVSKIIPSEVVKIPTLASISSDASLQMLLDMQKAEHENLVKFEYIDGPNYEVYKFQEKESLNPYILNDTSLQDISTKKLEQRIVENYRKGVQIKYSTYGILITSFLVSLISSVIFSVLVSILERKTEKKCLFLAVPLFLTTIFRMKSLVNRVKITGDPHPFKS
jgi:hypothetical protein